MKKHILIAQSLLLLSLGSAAPLFSMMEPSSQGLTSEERALLADILNTQDNDADLSLSMPSFFDEEEQQQYAEYIEETINLTTTDRRDEKKELFNDVHQLLQNPVILKTAEKLVGIKTSPKEYWENKHEQFQRILHNITSDAAPLKTLEIVETDKNVLLEIWKKEQAPVEKYEKMLNEVKTTNIALKQKQILTTPIEHQEKLRTVLNLLTNNPMAALKAPKIYPTNPALLTESIMITSTPLKNGLNNLPYTYQYGYEYGTHKPHHIIEYLFTNTEKDNTKKAQYLFDLKNETHVELLEQTFNYYISHDDDQAIMNLLEKCQCTAGELQINPRVASKIHNYLENVIKNEEIDSQLILKNKNEAFVKKSNALIIALQEELTQRTKLLHEEFNKYEADRNDTFAKKADYIRQLKENTIATHALSPDLKLSKNECSDAIDCLRSQTTKAKVYMTQQDVEAVCSNERLLKKIELSRPIATLQDNTQCLLRHINRINKSTQNVKLLT